MLFRAGAIKIPVIFWNIWLATFVIGLLSANPLHTSASLLAIPIFIKLLWREQELPILFFSLAMQWLSITIKVFVADIQNISFSSSLLHSFPHHIDKAFALSLTACLVLALGINRATRNVRAHGSIEEIIPFYNTRRCLTFYIIFSLAINSIIAIARIVPGLSQAIIHFVNLKWGFLAVVSLLVFKKRQYRLLLIAIICFEVIISFVAYFSGFKSYLLFLAIVILSFGITWNWKRALSLIIIFIISLDLVLTWTHIKPQYRAYLSGGKKAQIIIVSRSDALKKLIELATAMNADDYASSARSLVDRISYIDFFSACLGYIPQKFPYQNGGVLKTAVMHILAPRLFFPDKTTIDDSAELNRYTGLSVATAEKGVSISLGYIAQCYVDFGPFIMFIPILFLGVLIGFIYKSLMNQSLNLFWGYCLTAPLFFSCSLVEMTLRKMLGALIMYLIVAIITMKFAMPWIDKKIRSDLRA